MEHSRFSPHCRPDGAPNHTALLLRLPEFNSKPQVRRPKRSLLGEQSRGRWEGGVEAESFFAEEKHARLFLCVVARCCSNWCSPHIYGWVLVSVFSKFLFFKHLHIMSKFLQSTMSTCKIRSFVFSFPKMLQFSMVTDEPPPTFKYSFNWLRWVLAVACRAFSCSMWDLVPCRD